jgi:hypothetical protein
VTRRNAKYCCPSCRVTDCRRRKPKPDPAEKTTGRKPRSDKKYATQAERQRAYDYRKWGERGDYGLNRILRDYLPKKALTGSSRQNVGAKEPVLR